MIGSLAPWYGAKRTMAPTIVEALGPHAIYWEPFCGSMSIILAKPQSRTEVLNDLHKDLINLALCVRHPRIGPALYRRLRRVLASEDEFRAALAIVRASEPTGEGPDIDRAFHYFIASWQGMNGVAGTSKHNTNFARRFSSLGGDAGVRWRAAVKSIPQWRKRLERVQILSCDGIDLCLHIEDREGTAIYADPPYLVKGAKYLHDFGALDHQRLASALNRFRKTRCVVSYYDHPELAELYPGWFVKRVDLAKSLVNSGKRDGQSNARAPEVLLCNQPFAPEGLFRSEESS